MLSIFILPSRVFCSLCSPIVIEAVIYPVTTASIYFLCKRANSSMTHAIILSQICGNEPEELEKFGTSRTLGYVVCQKPNPNCTHHTVKIQTSNTQCFWTFLYNHDHEDFTYSWFHFICFALSSFETILLQYALLSVGLASVVSLLFSICLFLTVWKLWKIYRKKIFSPNRGKVWLKLAVKVWQLIE